MTTVGPRAKTEDFDRAVRAAVARERTRMADVLHDTVLAQLVLLRHGLLQANTTADSEWLSSITARVSQITADLHALTGALHEESLDEQPLGRSLELVAEAIRLHGRLDVDVRVEPSAQHLREPRVREGVRELLTNVVRHAGATSADVHAAVVGDELQVTVTDDGRGVTPGAVQAARDGGHLGLQRLARVGDRSGGSFRIEPAPGGGTIATLSLPVQRLTPDEHPAGDVVPGDAASAVRAADSLVVLHVDLRSSPESVSAGTPLAEALRSRLRDSDLIIPLGEDEVVCVIAGMTVAEVRARFAPVTAHVTGTAGRVSIADAAPGMTGPGRSAGP